MELDYVRWLTEQLSAGGPIALGIGDDAAVVNIEPGRQLVVTSDMITDQVHFDLGLHAAERIGRKALAVNLSDLAAMAAEPLAAVVSLNLPREHEPRQLAEQLTEGMIPLAEQLGCPVIGGDTNVTRGPLVISVTAFGTVDAGTAWRRSGAKPGDRMLVTGKLGGSLQGHHLDFTPRVAEALQLASQYDIHAAMDLSDGLSLDLARMTKASHVGAVVELAKLPITEQAARAAVDSGKSPAMHALSDGEDFELLLAVPPAVSAELLATQPLACGLTDVGEFTADTSLVQLNADGTREALLATGYEHR
ncbi:thiamine-phosphate kinase [Aeoliella mucimassa]|uniref:Thiamine-monophosphate kinase n=1 Tax=Aeoliella mucimassa TaxID=2527972 RepID=A0A518AK93_9BACT|nr:thiamine-phosphate kinase [Aeoliella mucimassa]QDU55149.1 Thiamine-monophosphate kinase [Aeoliella mucimassa]